MKTKEVVQKEALDAVRPFPRAGVAIIMGTGKTLLGLKHMREQLNHFKTLMFDKDIKFLVVAPKKSIHTTWKEDALKYGFHNEMNHCHFTTYLSLSKQSKDYQSIYLDESHSLKFSHDEWLADYKGHILGLTGTPPAFHKSEKGIMGNKYCPIVYRYNLASAVDDYILNDYSIVVHKLPLSKARSIKMTTKAGKVWYTSEYDSYMYWSEKIDEATYDKTLNMMRIFRMKAMMSYTSKEVIAKTLANNFKEKVIIFANTQEQADNLCTHSYHSKNPQSEVNLDNFKKGLIKKLSCVLQLNEGVNIPDLKYGVILHSYSNENKLPQRVARMSRLNPDDTSEIHIMCFLNTVDEKWVESSLETFDPLKIKYIIHG